MKKIIHWSKNYFPVLGGGPSYVSNITQHLSNYEHKILSKSLIGYPLNEYDDNHVQIIRMPKYRGISDSSHLSYILGPFYDGYEAISYYEYLKRNQYDLIIYHGVSFFQNIQRIDLKFKTKIHIRLTNIFNRLEHKLMTLHNFFPGSTQNQTIIDQYNSFISMFDNIICVDRHIYNYVNEYCKRNKLLKRIYFIPNPINVKLFSFSPMRDFDRIQIGFVGRFTDTNDILTIKDIIKLLPDSIDFHIALSGPFNQYEFSKPSKKNIFVYHNIKYKDMPNFYKKLHILFNPVLHDAITRVSLEAMAIGRPVIMYENFKRDPIIDNETGFLVPRNREKILDLINKISHHPDSLIRIGNNVRKLIENEYSNESIMPAIENAYNKAM